MMTLLQDLRYGARMLLKNRGVTIIAVLSLALGIGVNTTIFSLVNAVLIRPLPYTEPGRLVAPTETQLQQGIEEGQLSYPDFDQWRKQNQVFEDMAAYSGRIFNFAAETRPERIAGTFVSASLFSVLGVQPALGRNFLPEEDETKDAASRVAILSDDLWQRRFASDPRVVGNTLKLNGEIFTVIGVMPPGFKFPVSAELWVPLSLDADKADRLTHYLRSVARLKPGVTLEQAQAEMATIARRLEQQYPESNNGRGANIISLRDDVASKETQAVLYILLGAVGLVLLIACANVANLLLARATTRQKEVAIRAALGASRTRVLRQLLTESVLVAIAGGALGILLALWGLDLLAKMFPDGLPFWVRLDIDARVLVFTLLVSVATGLIFGLFPALEASKPDLHALLKESGRSSSAGAKRNRLRNLLVISEVALSLVLLIGATLMIESFLGLQRKAFGFDPENVLTLKLSVDGKQYAAEKQRAAFYRELMRRIKALPGVELVGATSFLPLDGSDNTNFVVENRATAPGEQYLANSYIVTPDYFNALRISLLRGRAFNEQDDAETPKVAIINETMAHRFFPNEDPTGKRFKRDNAARFTSIIGVVSDTPQEALSTKPEAQIYFPHAQEGWNSMTLTVRATRDPGALSAAIRNEIQSVDKDQPVYDVMTMNRFITRSFWVPRLYAALFSVFAGVALLLAVIGVYGVISYSVSQRTHEIGIRMALGARPRDVLKLVVGRGMILVLIGSAIGLAGAFALTRVLSNMLYGVSATDPLTFTGVAVLLAGVALLACYIPARRATKVDPMIALRHE